MTWTIGTSRTSTDDDGLILGYELELHKNPDAEGRPLEARAFAWPKDHDLLLLSPAVDTVEAVYDENGTLLTEPVDSAPAEYVTDPASVAQILAADALRQIDAEAAATAPAATDLVPPGTAIDA